MPAPTTAYHLADLLPEVLLDLTARRYPPSPAAAPPRRTPEPPTRPVRRPPATAGADAAPRPTRR